MLATQTVFVDVSISFAELALNWLLQSTLLLAVGLSLGRLLRRRGSAVQSVVYRTTLVAVLIGPLVTWGLSQTGVSGWSIQLPLGGGQQAATEPGLDFPPIVGKPLAIAAEATDQLSFDGNDRMTENLPVSDPFTSSAHTPQAMASPMVITGTLAEESTPVSYFSPVLLIALACWFLVALTLSLRLAFAWRQLAVLRKRSSSADAKTKQACQELASTLEVSPPEVLRSPCLPSPCLAGLRRPAVLLPEDDANLSIREVLVHELAHLKRHDCHWNLLRQVATALLPFQPLLWFLSRRIETTAEEVCDDYVVHHGGDRGAYAHRLVDIAQLSVAPIAAAGVGMVSFRSMLAQRVERIMDTSRTLSTRVGNLLLATVLVGGLIGTTLTGLVGLAPQPSQAEEGKVVIEVVDEAKENEQGTDSLISGKVIDANGNPVVGAKFFWMRSRSHDLDLMPPRLIATSDATGNYQFKLPSLGIAADAPASWGYLKWMVVRAPGHGVSIERPGNLLRRMHRLGRIKETEKGATIKLPEAGDSIRGRLVDEAGQPIVGATVRIRWLTEGDSYDWDRRDAEILDTNNGEWRARVSKLLGIIEPPALQYALPMATTDTQGYFELRDIGPKRLFQLLVEGERIASTQILARNEPGEVIDIPSPTHYGGVAHRVYGREFSHVIGRSNPVEGRVVDIDTGEPIPNAFVRAVGVHGDRLSSSRGREHLSTRTDADGRYRITGLPIGEGNTLVAFTTGDLPFVPVGHKVDTSGKDIVGQDFQLLQGIWAEGRVFDQESDKPFTGEIFYYYFQNKGLEKAVPGLRRAYSDGRYWTNANGEFRVPVLPTRGILAYRYDGRAFDRDGVKRFPRGYGAESIEGEMDKGMTGAFPTHPTYLIASDYNRLVEVNPTGDQTVVRADMPLVASRTVKIHVTYANRNPLIGRYKAYGAARMWGWERMNAPEFEVKGLKPGERRKIFVFQRGPGLAGGVIVDETHRETVTIKLQQAGSIAGRLVDPEGNPITDASLSCGLGEYRADEETAIWAPHPELSSGSTNLLVDSDGRFRVEGLIPGWKYTANVTAPREWRGVRSNMMGIGVAFTDEIIEPGEAKDLGDVVIGSKEAEEK